MRDIANGRYCAAKVPWSLAKCSPGKRGRQIEGVRGVTFNVTKVFTPQVTLLDLSATMKLNLQNLDADGRRVSPLQGNL
jgi:hypothetical protein